MLQQITPVPNALFDRYLAKLQGAELKILMIIIRQTLGWKDDSTKSERKERDWICGSQLQKKTGCSARAISPAVQALIDKNLIEVTDDKGFVLHRPEERRGRSRLYFKLSSAIFANEEKKGITREYPVISFSTSAIIAEDIRKNCLALGQKMQITK